MTHFRHKATLILATHNCVIHTSLCIYLFSEAEEAGGQRVRGELLSLDLGLYLTTYTQTHFFH